MITAANIKSRLSSPRAAGLVLGVITLLWIVTFSILVVRRQNGFWSVDFDMGIYDQAVWLLARGHSFITVRGLPVFGHHATFALLLFAPASWLGSGPNFLNVSQVVAMGLGVVPIYLLARTRSLGGWVAAALAVAFLLHPALQFFTAELFHPEAMAITPLLMAYLCISKRSWRWFAFWAGFAVLWKEDVALAVAMLGIIIAIKAKKPSSAKRLSERQIGLITTVLALLWFFFVSQILMPTVSGYPAHYGELYQGVGGSAGGMLETLVNDPGNITSRLTSSETQHFGWQLLAPYGLTSLLAPLELLIGLPQFILDALSDYSWTRTITFRYAALPLVAVTLAMVEGVAFVFRRTGQATGQATGFGRRGVVIKLLPLGILACAFAATIAWGPSPIGDEYHSGIWPPAVDSRRVAQNAAVAAVTNNGAVSATFSLVPQFSGRREIYTFPNPWRRQNWGVPGSKKRNPDRVEWLVVDRWATDSTNQQLVDSLITRGVFKTVFDKQGIVVARRSAGGS